MDAFLNILVTVDPAVPRAAHEHRSGTELSETRREGTRSVGSGLCPSSLLALLHQLSDLRDIPSGGLGS